MTLKNFWDAIDTYERQAQGKTSYTDKKVLLPIEMKDDPVVVEHRDRWGWLDAALKAFREAHAGDGDVIEITSREFANELRVEKNMWPITARKVLDLLPNVEVIGSRGAGRPTKYIIPNKLLLE